MRRKIIAVFIVTLLALCCCGCQMRNVTSGMEEGQYYDAVISIKVPEEESDEKNQDQSVEILAKNSVTKADVEIIQTISRMPTMTDAEASKLLGGGSKNMTADGKLLIGRNYTVELFGESCELYTSYGNDMLVELAYLLLPGEDIEIYEDILTALYGEADIDPESQTSSWKLGAAQMMLYQDESIVLDFCREQIVE